jgi:hypothetical protein
LSHRARLSVRTLAIIALVHAMTLCADEWGELRRRPGNDDIYVMVDTSLSMAPSLGGVLDGAKRFLQDPLVRCVKEGDRVIIMTFDSEAHVRSVVPITDRRRDAALLRDVIDGIDARRVIPYHGTYPDLIEIKDGALLGGGAWSDYCEMLRLASAAIRNYGDSRHRQLFLLFAGGRPSAPSYRRCNDPDVPSAFTTVMRKDGLRLGVIALPSGVGSTEELVGSLSRLVRRLAGGVGVAEDSVRVIDLPETDHGIDAGRRAFLELISSGIDLVEPVTLALGDRYRADLRSQLTVVNRSRASQRLSIRGAILKLEGTRETLGVTVIPSDITLLAGQRGTLTLVAHDILPEPGRYRGSLAFTFGTASRFSPAVLEFSATKMTWWQAFGPYVVGAAAALTVLLIWLLFACVVSCPKYQRAGGGPVAVADA